MTKLGNNTMKTHYLITGVLLSTLLSGYDVNRDISVPEHAHVSGTSTIIESPPCS